MFLPDPIKSENFDHFVPSAINYLNKNAYNAYQSFSNNFTQNPVEKSTINPPSNPNYRNFYNNFNYNPNYHHHYYYCMNDLEYPQQTQNDPQDVKNQNWSRKLDEEYLNPYTPPISSSPLTSLDYDFEVPQQQEKVQCGQLNFSLETFNVGAQNDLVKNKNELQKGQEYGCFWSQNDIESLCKISKSPGSFKEKIEVLESSQQTKQNLKKKQRGKFITKFKLQLNESDDRRTAF